MIDFLSVTFAGFQAMSGWEYLAVTLALAYLILAMRQSLWCWPAAFLSTFIYTVLFYNGALLMDSLLNVYYMVMAIYGWYFWRFGSNLKGNFLKSNDLKGKKYISNNTTANPSTQSSTPITVSLSIESWSLERHLKHSFITLIIALCIGFYMDSYTHADFAYLDSLTTCFSLLATYMVVKKVLENWLYWVIIDGLSMYLYVNKGFYPTTILFALYTILAIWGYLQWQQAYEQDELAAAS